MESNGTIVQIGSFVTLVHFYNILFNCESFYVFDVLTPIEFKSSVVKSLEFVNSSDGMNISGYNVDYVVFGVEPV
jgi:hypothetical protein